MSKQKYYVVWSGKQPGIYLSWEECKRQVHGVTGSQYKSYSTREEAEEAFNRGAKTQTKSSQELKMTQETSEYIQESVSVDAACSGNPGDMEYQGVYTRDSQPLFHYGPVANGTNNIGEFLAIVHALAFLKEKASDLPIYSDSQIALGWVRKKKANTSIERNDSTEHLFELIERAEKWLKTHSYSNPLLKWDTKAWGESKADFDRK